MPQNATIVGLGEILWDIFPSGPRFGGAPANFACSAAGLSGDQHSIFMVSAVGNDTLGEQAIAALQSHRVNTGCVAQVGYPTGQVLVDLDAEGHATYEFADDAAWDHLTWSTDLGRLAANADVVCFGSLGQRSEDSATVIQRFLDATSPTTLRIFDINLRAPHISEANIERSLRSAAWLKLNEAELPWLAERFGLAESESNSMRSLAEMFELQGVALTRGSRGSAIWSANAFVEFDGEPCHVEDTVGAGDAFTARLALGLIAEESLETLNRRACEVAAFVCTKSGATPQLPSSLLVS